MGRWRLNLLFLVMGAAAMAAQVLCLRRLIVVFGGNELVSGAVFAGWLFWSGMGTLVAGRRADRLRDAPSAAALLLGAVALAVPLTVAGAALVKGALGIPPPELVGLPAVVGATVLIMAPLGFLIGAAFTVACRLPATGSAADIGRVWALDAVGCGIGGFLFSLVGIRFLTPMQSAFAVAAVLAAAVGIASARSAPKVAALAAGVLLAAGLPLVPQVDDALARLQWEGYNPVAHRESRFASLMVTANRGERTLFADGRPAFSLPLPEAYETAAHFPLAEHPDPKDILLVGGGISGMIAPLGQWTIDEAHFAVLDPDAVVLERNAMPSELAALPPWARLHIGDGRKLIREGLPGCRTACLDIIIIGVGDPDTAAADRYFTAEFFAEAKRMLRPGGILALALLEPANVVGPEQARILGSVLATLTRTFPHLVVMPFGRYWFAASAEPGILTDDADELARRLDRRGIAAPFFRDRELAGISPERIQSTRAAIERAAAAAEKDGLNTDAKPIAYYAGMLLWEARTGRAGEGALALLSAIEPWMAGGLLFAAAALSVLLGRGGGDRRRARVEATWVLAATGFASIAGELALLVSYQMSEGLLVWRIGLVVTAFMVGAGTGAAVCAQWLAGRAASTRLQLLALLLFAGSLMLLPLVAKASFLAANGLMGLLSGIVYQGAASRLVASGRGVGTAAGIIESADHWGAALGALAASLAIIPLFGIAAAFSSGAVVLVIAAAVVALMAFRRRRSPESA